MARRKAGKRKSAGRLGAALAPSALLARLGWVGRRPVLAGAAWCLMLAALAAAWIAGVPRLHAATAARATGANVTVEFVNLPAWVNGDLLALLDVTARHHLSGDPLRRDDLVAARAALLETGWFASIEQVRRLHADLVMVRSTMVTPAAVIRDDEGDHLVDPAGRLLPRTYPHDGAQRQLVVTGAHFDRPPRAGLPWEGADVTAALRLLRVIDASPWRDQVTAIDAGRFLSEGTLVMVTDLGARIEWGSAPGEETGLEVSAEGKLAYLLAAYEEFGRIDTGHAGTLHFSDRGYFAE